ncbi:MAG: hypothetical protein QM723_20940 [Myxococcaceae bacterium]
MAEPEAPAAEPKRPVWKSPFAIAFVFGIVFLTVLPFAQRRFLKAPPPLKSLNAWSLQLPDGGTFGSAQLKGDVWVANFTFDGCDPQCGEHQALVGHMLRDFDSKGAPIKLVSFVSPLDGGIADSNDPRWFRVSGEPAAMNAIVVGGFREGFNAFTPIDAGTSVDDFIRLPVLALVDQDGALRGFWKDDQVGRGNVINAALLLSKYGPKP